MIPIAFDIQLSGTDTAACAALSMTISARSPICAIARAMIERGVNPEAKMIVRRSDTTCFAARPVGWWADRNTSEGDGRSVQLVKWRPLDPNAFGASRTP